MPSGMIYTFGSTSHRYQNLSTSFVTDSSCNPGGVDAVSFFEGIPDDPSFEERAAEGLGPAYDPGPGRDPEVVAEGIAEPTARERNHMDSLSSVDLQIFSAKLDSIVDEARHVMEQLSMEPALQIGDGCTAIFTASGDMCSIATGVPFHALLHYGPIKYVRKHFTDDPTVGVEPGDIFFFNEALSGAVHAYDMFTFMPVFHEGDLIAWVTCGGHQGEAGAKGPGGFTPDARSRYEEGFHAPPFKIGEDFEIKTDAMEFLANSVRNPDFLQMDQRTRVAVCMRQRKRLLEEVERRGADTVVGGMREIIRRDAEHARERLQEFNDGSYRHVTFLDTIGTDDGLVRVPVELRKKGNRLLIDLSGLSPQHLSGPFHTFWHFVRATMSVFLFPFVFDGLHKSIGLIDPITVKVPPGTLYNTTDPDAAHGQATFMGRAATITGHQAGMKMLYDSDYSDKVMASKSANVFSLFFEGKNQHGLPIAGTDAESNAAGGGARHDMDGVDSIGFYWSPVVDCLSVEQVEKNFPFLYLFYDALSPDRHGFGKYRGGQGVAVGFKPHRTDDFASTSVGMGERFSMDFGLFGGYAGPTTHGFYVSDSDIDAALETSSERVPTDFEHLVDEQPLDGEYVSASQNRDLVEHSQSDVLVKWMSSGGGYGDVLEREPAAVQVDLDRGLISERTAREVYCTVVEDGTVDPEETARLRERVREKRLAESQSFEAFESEWLDRKPGEELLTYYGEWPEPDT